VNKKYFAMLSLLPCYNLVYGEEDPVETDPGITDPNPGQQKPPQQKPAQTKPAPTKTPKMIPEEEFNNHVGKLRKSLESKLEQASNNAKLTAEERDAARSELETLQQEYKTKEQLSQEAITKAEKKHQAELKAEREARESAQKNYEELLIDVELTREESSVGPSIPGALVDAMRSKTKLVDAVNDEGKKTGKKVVRLEFDDFDKDGKPIKSLYPVSEAFKRMKELPQRYGIYFKGVGAGGVGGNSGREAQHGSLNQPGVLPKSIEEYAAARNAARAKARSE
jgi:hypothetical protein